MNATMFIKKAFSTAIERSVIKPCLLKNSNLKIKIIPYKNYSNSIAYKNILSHTKSNDLLKFNAFLQSRDFSSVQSNSIKNGPLMKKRLHKKRYVSELDPDNFEDGRFPVLAYATAKEYDLEHLKMALMAQNLYKPQKLPDQELCDVLVTTAKYQVGPEPRHVFFFREGCVVFWNCGELEVGNVLSFLADYQMEPYSPMTVLREREAMSYKYQVEGKNCQLVESCFFLSPEPENVLERYTFSNAMSQSVKLGVWEAQLDQFADSVSTVTGDLEQGRPIKMNQEQVLRKSGALFALRHQINLESDLLDTPDFYWEQAELEKLYGATTAYFSLSRRTRVLNEKLSHCAELVELVAAQLSDRHHVRLEWMIIILIMVEVGFETLHFLERYWHVVVE